MGKGESIKTAMDGEGEIAKAATPLLFSLLAFFTAPQNRKGRLT